MKHNYKCTTVLLAVTTILARCGSRSAPLHDITPDDADHDVTIIGAAAREATPPPLVDELRIGRTYANRATKKKNDGAARQLCVFEVVVSDECKSRQCFGTVCDESRRDSRTSREMATNQCSPSHPVAEKLNSIQCDRVKPYGNYVLHIRCDNNDADVVDEGHDALLPRPPAQYCYPGR
eukprot:9276254-Pyramimonas_sp.AAC.2